MKKAIEMTVEELVKAYYISLYGDDKIKLGSGPAAERDGAIETIKARKPEILSYLLTKRQAEQDRAARRAANRKAIEGLAELEAAHEDLDKWEDEFADSFKTVGGLGVRPKPEYDFEGMKQKYPGAAALFRAESIANQSNYNLAAIGQKAVDSILDNPADYEQTIAQMDKEYAEEIERHMWD